MTLTPETYYDHPAVSQSDLKLLRRSPRLYKATKEGKIESPEKKKKHLLVGSLIDCKVLTPNDFSKKFVQRPRDMNIPKSPQEKAFCDAIQQGIGPLKSLQEVGYKGAPTEKEAMRLMDKFDTYLNYLSGMEGREEYTFNDFTVVQAALHNIALHKKAKELLVQKGDSQVPILFELLGIPCRSLLDRLYLDADTKTARLTDLKTTGFPVDQLRWSVRKWGYHFQAAFYVLAVKGLLKSLGENPEEWSYEYYIVGVETNPLYEVKVFRLPLAAIEEGMKQVKDAFMRLKWHHTNNVWDQTQEEYENGGVCELPWYQFAGAEEDPE